MGAVVPFLAAAAPIFKAVGGIAGSLLGGGGKSGGGSQAAPPPPPAEPDVVDPAGTLDEEATRLRALRRRREQEDKANLLSLSDATTVSQKTLLGE